MEIYVEKTNAMKVKHNKLFQYRPEMNLHGTKRNLQLGTYFLKRHTIRVFFYNEFIQTIKSSFDYYSGDG